MGNTQSTEPKPTAANSIPASSATSRQAAISRNKEVPSSTQQTSGRLSNTPPSIAPQPARTSGSLSPSSSHPRTQSSNTAVPPVKAQESPASSSYEDHRPVSRSSAVPIPIDSSPSTSAKPIDVPQSENQRQVPAADIESANMTSEEPVYGHASNTFSRPPRLPLPIEEEAHAPGSPIISPNDINAPLDEKEVEDSLARQTSVLSSTTIDDDEIGEHDLYQGDQSGPTVPTHIEWKGPGDKVYVTGTFVQWERKFKLHRDKGSGIFSTTLQLKPGTHHIKFLVDDDMQTSNDLPTTVDFTNIFVNYIEVVAPYTSQDEQASIPSDPVPIPGTAITAGQAEGTDQPAARPIPIRGTSEQGQASSAHEPITIPGSLPQPKPSSPVTAPQAAAEDKPPKEYLPRGEYTKEIPQFLLDLDRYATPEDERFQRASRVANTLPHPPSLPLFLAKSILNTATPHKDDASVLSMPNHTVLNHLATSSIRSGVLATSGTTRYKRKFLTTIMYRPTSDDG